MGGAFSMRGKYNNAYNTLIAKPERKDYFLNMAIDGKIILQFIIKERGVN
jgi:hypothetical protein